MLKTKLVALTEGEVKWRKLTWKGSYSGLSGPATAAHFHTGEAGKNGGVAVPIFAGAAAKTPFEGEATLTDAQAAAATKLLATGKIAAFAKANPSADAAKRNAFADSLAKEGYDLPTRILRILVANELGRTRIPPVYDLEFDTALNAALAVIANPKYSQLLASAKTVREIVEARKAAMGAPADPKKADARAAAGAALPSPEIKN